MKRRYRLGDEERFRQVRQTGTSFSHRLVVLCLLPNEQDATHCGFTASRRIGNAVVRNRARRRMREAVRLLLDLVEPGWDMVWIARTAINEAEFSELQNACARLLRRARLLRAEPSALEGSKAESCKPRGDLASHDGAESLPDTSGPGSSQTS